MPDVGHALRPQQARVMIRSILASGGVRWGDHALRELAKDRLEVGDAVNVLRAGIVREPEYENGEWRYHVETPSICVVVAFRSETALRVVTAWRKRR
jgi:hypothetical protein